MNAVANERLCVICRSPLSASNTSDRCRRHQLEEGDQPLFKLIPPDVGSDHEERGAETAPPQSEVSADVLASREQVLKAVAEIYKVTREEILSRGRQPRLVRPRHVTMYLLRTELKMTLPKIADFLKRDHTTIMHGCEQMTQKVLTDVVLAKEVEAIRSRMSKMGKENAAD